MTSKRPPTHTGGRRPKPTALKLVQGNPGRRPLNEAEPQPPVTIPKCPARLKGEARKAWSALAPILAGMRVLTEADVFALERLAECHAEIVELRRDIKKHGRVYQTTNGAGAVMHRPRPEVGMLSAADRRFKSYLIEFGLTPAARSKVQTSGPQKEGDIAKKYFG